MRPLVRIINLQNATLFIVNGKDKNKGDMVTMLGVTTHYGVGIFTK
jgi:hypothetical protein